MRSRHTASSSTDDPRIPGRAATTGATCPEPAPADELSRQVQAALNRLPSKQRAATVLTCYENQSHAEAAQTLGCTEATISWRVFAARQTLKRLRAHPISHLFNQNWAIAARM